MRNELVKFVSIFSLFHIYALIFCGSKPKSLEGEKLEIFLWSQFLQETEKMTLKEAQSVPENDEKEKKEMKETQSMPQNDFKSESETEKKRKCSTSKDDNDNSFVTISKDHIKW